MVELQSLSRDHGRVWLLGLVDIHSAIDTNDTLKKVSLVGQVEAVPLLDRAGVDEVLRDHLHDHLSHDAIAAQKVKAIEAMVSDKADLGSKKLLRTVSPDKLDGAAVGNYEEQLVARDKVLD